MYHQPAPTVPITREGFLLTAGRPVVQGQYTQTDSPITSSSRVRWVQLSEWATFDHNLAVFWQSLPTTEKQEYITDTAFLNQYRQFVTSTLPNPTNEDMLSQHLDAEYSQPHNWAARHSATMLNTHSRIIRRDDFYQPIGRPDYLFVEQENSPSRGLYAVMELKTFWKVTSVKIAEVLNGDSVRFLKFADVKGTASATTSHVGRLAIEQIYGYMVRNAKKYGILTTVNGWVFFMRENGGMLHMTPVIDCQVTHPSFTILQALYYISALASHNGHLPETDGQGNPVQIELADSKYPVASPSVTGYPTIPTMSSSTTAAATFIYPPRSGQQYGLVKQSLGHGLVLEPWKSTNRCGGKSFRSLLMPNSQPVIVKLWDGYKSQSDPRDQEVSIYMVLQELWGTHIPRLICSTNVDFCFGLVLEEIEVLTPPCDELTLCTGIAPICRKFDRESQVKCYRSLCSHS